MAKIIVIVEKLKDWNSYYPVEQLMTPQDYLVNWTGHKSTERIKVINLCRNFKYLSNGYYCSLLAEGRGHSVIPSIKTINELSHSFFYHLQAKDLDEAIQRAFKGQAPTSEDISITIYFGETDKEVLKEVARQIFDVFPAPILHVEFQWDKVWQIHTIRTGSINTLSESDEDVFASAVDEYADKIWRKPKSRKKKFRYDMAILHNPLDPMPPSDKKALENFVKAGRDNDILVELIEKKDYTRIAEFDALFIRETTSLENHTYRFAKKAESEGLVVVDDSMSILRCTNKIFMQNILDTNHINSPKTLVIGRDFPEQLNDAVASIGFPMIIKVPDGAFSKGVFKVQDMAELVARTDDLFKKTALLIAQEYFYTDFDWRIGTFNNRVIYACKYFMTKGHWQIYDHAKKMKKGVKVGDAETFPISQVPKNVIHTALKLSNLVGDSLYGVDLKEKNGKAFVIEINDNPNIDHNVEDAIVGQDLYHNIMHEFVRRIEAKK